MFYLIQGNRIERLALELGRLIRKERQRRFSLEPAVVIVNNFEMGRWLSEHIAGELGIFANVRFTLAGTFIWELAGSVFSLEGQETVTLEDLLWLILSHLQDSIRSGIDDEVKDPALAYLKTQDSRELFHLAGELASVFDRYLNYRWDMVMEWESGADPEAPDMKWQARLWRGVLARSQGIFRMNLIRKFLGGLHHSETSGTPPIPTDHLPRRLFIFGVSHVPPLHMNILASMSEWTDVYFFAVNPSRHYWEYIVTEKFKARLKAADTPASVDELFPRGNRLLASLGRAGRAFLSNLYELSLRRHERDLFFPPEGDDLLHDIQHNILELRRRGRDDLPRRRIARNDHSIVVASCYSRTREVEALHDHLVDLFDSHPELRPHHVAVMAPDISKYVPLVHAVFGSAPENRFIPYTLCDVGVEAENESVKAFLALLHTVGSDLNAPELMDILSIPTVSKRFELGPDELSWVRSWVAESGIRRGSGMHGDGTQPNSWRFGLDRLFLSYATSTDRPVSGVLPLETAIEGSWGDALGSLSSFFFKVHQLHESLQAESVRTVDAWEDVLRGILEDFLWYGDEVPPEIQELMDSLTGLFQAMRKATLEELPRETLLAALESALQRPTSPRAFFSGNVTFSSLVPMRTIPFSVICLLGMNDEDFPRNPPAPSFDLVARNPKRGERLPRDEDRYLFLETLLSARKHLYISFVGRDEHDDSIKNPSGVVSELLDTMEEEYEGEQGGSIVDQILRHHPLQPFSRKYLDDPRGLLFTYARNWFPQQDERKPPGRRIEIPPFVDGPIQPADDEMERLRSVTPGELVWFFSNPSRYFLKHVLKVDLDLVEDLVLEDSEPFWIGPEIKWRLEREFRQLESRLVSSLAGDSSTFEMELFQRLKLEGLLPAEPLNELAWETTLHGDLEKLLELIARHGVPRKAPSVQLSVRTSKGNEIRITGNPGFVGNQDGLLDYVFTLYDHHRIAMWIRHVIYTVAGPSLPVAPGKCVVLNTKTPLVYDKIDLEQARRNLQSMVELFVQGHFRPIPFFSSASYAYAKQLNPKGKPPRRDEESLQKAISSAWKKLFPWKHVGSRFKDRWLPVAFRGRLDPDRLLDQEFKEVSQRILGTMLTHMEKGR